ncbi:MAG: hypothetical protein ACRERD_16890, partial [Candidatus Binatia bacterium]
MLLVLFIILLLLFYGLLFRPRSAWKITIRTLQNKPWMHYVERYKRKQHRERIKHKWEYLVAEHRVVTVNAWSKLDQSENDADLAASKIRMPSLSVMPGLSTYHNHGQDKQHDPYQIPHL